MLVKFVPENDIETAIQQTKQGKLTALEFLSKLASAELYVSSLTEILTDGSGFAPLLLESDGRALVAVFTSLDRAQLHRDQASYGVKMAGDQLILRMPPDYGVILNPGFEMQLIIPSENVVQLAQNFRKLRGNR